MVSIGNVAIHVKDIDRSEAFYTEVLGLEVVARIETPEVREVIVAGPDGGSQLLLAQPATPEGPVVPAGIWKVFVQTDDAAALYAKAVDAGAVAVAEPKLLEQFKVTIAFVQDPDGYLLELGQIHPR